MRISHKLLLLAVTAIAAMAFGASSASAVSPVEVVTETDGEPTACSPCVVHIVGATTLTAHVPMLGEVPASFCQDEFTAEIHHDGTGHIVNQVLTGPETCTQEPCDTTPTDETEWPIHGMEEIAPGVARATVEFCLQEAPDGPEHKWCTIGIDITETGDHHYVLTSAPGSSCLTHESIDVEVNGTWTVEDREGGEDPIEIVHL